MLCLLFFAFQRCYSCSHVDIVELPPVLVRHFYFCYANIITVAFIIGTYFIVNENWEGCGGLMTCWASVEGCVRLKATRNK